MTSKEIQLPSGAAAPDRVGQATAVEQSRAIAEVQGAIIVAQKVPRNVAGAVASMTESCSQMYLAERAQFRFPRGGTNVSGTSVYLARELARCWGNVQYGVSELRRDDYHGQSEMMAYAWDVQTNTRIETKFIVVHVRDTKTGTTLLVDQRDIYENNANNGARRVRECILSILPPWFVDQAKALCAKTLKEGGGVPLPRRIAETVANFAKLGVTQSQLEKKQGRGTNAWTEVDIAQLHVVGRSLSTGEARREDEFEPDLVTVQEVTDAAPKPAVVPAPQEAPTEVDSPGEHRSHLTHLVSEEDLPQVLEEIAEVLKGEQEAQAGDGGAATSDEPGHAKASKALVAAVKTLLADNEVIETADQRAVVSFLSGERVPMLADLTDTEARYLLRRVPELAEKGTFGDTVERARAAAKS